ncbi:DUF6587 family protein [Asticcacaulis sp. EMRT-3]|uniref:DUF6587 family protein n=1 Tax=Asticcacaulis sp. EMRT-3 TaxID=3040349 RepID=UPI0024AF17EB|nr:DUF6587 family protein [Asticcacaulis sp. EMRT-3]MDI7776075.1 hypothetical protein [Asticcacaulis sp. EMRT-3]
MLYAVIQFVIITAVVVFSLWQLAKKLLPNTVRDVQGRMARLMDRRGLHGLAHAVQPAAAPATGCGSGCGSCKGCGLSEVKKG